MNSISINSEYNYKDVGCDVDNPEKHDSDLKHSRIRCLSHEMDFSKTAYF